MARKSWKSLLWMCWHQAGLGVLTVVMDGQSFQLNVYNVTITSLAKRHVISPSRAQARGNLPMSDCGLDPYRYAWLILGLWMGSPKLIVNFEKWQCRLSLALIFLNATCRIYDITISHVTIFLAPMSHVTSAMSHVEFKKCLCRPVDFRSQWPLYCRHNDGPRPGGDRFEPWVTPRGPAGIQTCFMGLDH